jgi:SAM-dependent methyltransferase
MRHALHSPKPEKPGDRIYRQWEERVVRYARESVPKLRPFATALVDLVPPPAGARVLDVATGTGIVAAEAATRVGPSGSVVATDFLASWEPFVRQSAAEAGAKNLDFVIMPAEALKLPDNAFDVAYCQFGLMFFADPEQALREMRRVLRSGGRLGVAVWSTPEKVGLFLVSNVVGPTLPPPVDPFPSPMSMGTPGLLGGLVEAAGFNDVTVHHVVRYHEIPDPETEWRSWTDDPSTPTGSGLASLPATKQKRLHDEAIACLAAFRVGDVIRLPSEVIVVTATA